ncbi:hypothetical protein PIB30_002663 [Stylosanthes scabra]|uniref:Amino acid transporter transmembrane domain-containing protein n=1 Tax=Stylosanthes scabra TaxID=79078 RepID=A0ABU6Q2Z0_9FABA|nr:hypothetical protein [Stylosanthes scabra]
MVNLDTKTVSEPLLEPHHSTKASKLQTLGNIIVSVVGTGVLGLPYAFRIAGWVAGSLGVAIVGITTYYCMLLLVMCRRKLASEEPLVEAITYGDLGYRSFGASGRYMTELLILVAQCGGSVAYLVFIGQNLHSVFQSYGITMNSFLFMLVPVEIGLSWIGSLSALAPFSIFADVCNILAIAIVVKEDIQQVLQGEFSFGQRTTITSNIGGLPFAAGMAVGLCIGLVFTFPTMLHPLNEIVEGKLKIFQRDNDGSARLGKPVTCISRTVVVVVLAILASFVPEFSVFASFVGSTICGMMSFVLPATFHLKLFGRSLSTWQRALDFIVLFSGLFFAIYGTYNTIVGV